jgi:nucleoside-diphosphate-sugar epimerase
MRAVVTGAAGFIGSTLVDRLLADGHTVVGLDAFTDYYPVDQKRANVAAALDHDAFRLVEDDLRTTSLDELLDGAEAVFHQAAQPGVRLSWSAFARYVDDNVLATQRLLEAAQGRTGVRIVYASSSSVYGPALAYPTAETAVPQPHSPYGVTKLAGEHLTRTYAANWGVHTVALRYFTVYGPRQRPDMAIHRLIEAALGGGTFPLLGDGSQVRDFTYVDDIVDANVRAATADIDPGAVLNVAGASSWSMHEVIELVERLTGRPVELEHLDAARGDVHRTGGDTTQAEALLGWRATTDLEVGVQRQVAWHHLNR